MYNMLYKILDPKNRYLLVVANNNIKAYNLYAASIEAQALGLPQTTDYNVAVDFFIRKEIKYAVQKIISISHCSSRSTFIIFATLAPKSNPMECIFSMSAQKNTTLF